MENSKSKGKTVKVKEIKYFTKKKILKLFTPKCQERKIISINNFFKIKRKNYFYTKPPRKKEKIIY